MVLLININKYYIPFKKFNLLLNLKTRSWQYKIFALNKVSSKSIKLNFNICSIN